MNGVQTSIVKQAMDSPELLTEWEHDFVDSLSKRDPSYELSEKQNETLNRILQKLI